MCSNSKITHLDFTKMKSLIYRANTTPTAVMEGFPQCFITDVGLDLKEAFAIQLPQYGRATLFYEDKLLTVPILWNFVR